jgi:hypothetical protein
VFYRALSKVERLVVNYVTYNIVICYSITLCYYVGATLVFSRALT